MPGKGFYSIASVPGIVLIVMGYGELKTSPIILYSTRFWMHLLVNGALADAIVLVAGLVLYAATILWLHEWLFGIPVIV